MKAIAGYLWPNDVGDKWKHSLKHVKSLEWSIARCTLHRTAVQAGGNIGLWPRRLAEVFQRVVTTEPDYQSWECLVANMETAAHSKATIEVLSYVFGDRDGWVGMTHESLGSHAVYEDGADKRMVTIDSLELYDLDFLQLDIEGYEWHALSGAIETLKRCKPLVQVELRDFTLNYGKSDYEVRALLGSLGYREVSQQPGNDFVFEVAG